MSHAALAFERYRLEVVLEWPDGKEKQAVLAAIRSSLLKYVPQAVRQENGASFDTVFVNAARTTGSGIVEGLL